MELREIAKEYGPSAIRATPKPTKPRAEAADIQTHHAVYTALSKELSLCNQDRENLRRRGLSEEAIERDGYVSFRVEYHDTFKIASILEEEFGRDTLLTIPGFREDKNGRIYISSAKGIFIPCRQNGLIVAFQIRTDGNAKNRYKFLSSRTKADQSSPSPGHPLHMPVGSEGPYEDPIITEGLLKGNIIAFFTGKAVIATPGAYAAKAREAVEVAFSGGAKSITIAYDADADTNRNVAKAVLASAMRARDLKIDFAYLSWDKAKAKGLDDLLAAGLQPEETRGDAAWEAILKVATRAGVNVDEQSALARGIAPIAGQTRPQIILNAQEAENVDQAVAALCLIPGFYQQLGSIVTIRRDEAPSRGINRPRSSPRIVAVPIETIAEELGRVVDFVRVGKDGGTTPVQVPMRVAKAVYLRMNFGDLPHLEQIVESPVLRHDGTVLERPGHDVSTGILFDPPKDVRFEAVPPAPTLAQVQGAVKALFDLVADFPWKRIPTEDDATIGRSAFVAWLAILLTCLARHAYAGPCPIFLIVGNCPGTGKSLLADIISLIVTGRLMPRMTYPDGDEEMRKRFTSIFAERMWAMLIDNIPFTFGGASIDAAGTGTVWNDRMLGQNRMSGELPILTTIIGNGNNTTVVADTARRIVIVPLQTSDERPEERDGFRIEQPILEYVAEHRARLLCSALTILRGFVAAGRPKPVGSFPPFGSYEGWSGLIRNACIWATGTDPLAARKDLIANDQASQDRAALVIGWSQLPEEHAGKGITVSRAIETLKGNPTEYAALRNVLLGFSKTNDLPSVKSIGMRLNAQKGRVVDGHILERVDLGCHTYAWKVKRVEDGTKGTNGTNSSPSRERSTVNEQCIALKTIRERTGNSSISSLSSITPEQDYLLAMLAAGPTRLDDLIAGGVSSGFTHETLHAAAVAINGRHDGRFIREREEMWELTTYASGESG